MVLDKFKKGYSLTEVLVTMIIFSVLILVFSQIMISAISISNEIYQTGRAREQVSEILSEIKKDVQNAFNISDCSKSTCTITLQKIYIWELCNGTNGNNTSICKYEKVGTTKNLIKKTPDTLYIKTLNFESQGQIMSPTSTPDSLQNTTILVSLESTPIFMANDLTKIQNNEKLFQFKQIYVSTRNTKIL